MLRFFGKNYNHKESTAVNLKARRGVEGQDRTWNWGRTGAGGRRIC